jgi:hypothetical protein
MFGKAGYFHYMQEILYTNLHSLRNQPTFKVRFFQMFKIQELWYDQLLVDTNGFYINDYENLNSITIFMAK